MSEVPDLMPLTSDMFVLFVIKRHHYCLLLNTILFLSLSHVLLFCFLYNWLVSLGRSWNGPQSSDCFSLMMLTDCKQPLKLFHNVHYGQLVLTGSNLLLHRIFIGKSLPEELHFISFDSETNLCPAIYVSFLSSCFLLLFALDPHAQRT